MRIKLAPNNRGIATVGAVIIICLLLVFVIGFFTLMVRVLHRIDTHNVGGGNEATNELAYTGPGVVVWQQTNIVAVSPTTITAELIEHTTNLLGSWETLTNFTLGTNQVYDWTTLIDKSQPQGFFRITLYGTN